MVENLENEIWKDVIGYEGYYQVSNMGRIKSLNYLRTNKERILNIFKDKGGYLILRLCKKGKVKNYKLHRLVAQAFLPNPEEKSQVNHKNGIKNDNRVYNLEWNTNLENSKHARLTGLNNTFGENHGMSKLNEKDVLEIRNKYIPKFYSTYKLAKEYHVTQAQISLIILRKSWKHI